MLRLFSGVALLGAILMATVSAHHSPGAAFVMDQLITVEGTLNKVDWVNPHVLVRLTGKDNRGKTGEWVFEAHPPSWFRRAGVGRQDFNKGVGQAVTITGMPARDGTTFAYFKRITFPDGTFLQFAEETETPAVQR